MKTPQMTNSRNLRQPKSERRVRGEWFKMQKKLALTAVRSKLIAKERKLPDGSTVYERVDDAQELAKIEALVVLVDLFYRYSHRLQDIENYVPWLAPGWRHAITLLERQIRELEPRLILYYYNPRA